MLGYLFGILITGLIVTSVAIDCYKVKESLRRKMQNKISGLQLAIEKEGSTYKYEVEVLKNEILKIERKAKKK